jgi:hypothetical protein
MIHHTYKIHGEPRIEDGRLLVDIMINEDFTGTVVFPLPLIIDTITLHEHNRPYEKRGRVQFIHEGYTATITVTSTEVYAKSESMRDVTPKNKTVDRKLPHIK